MEWPPHSSVNGSTSSFVLPVKRRALFKFPASSSTSISQPNPEPSLGPPTRTNATNVAPSNFHTNIVPGHTHLNTMDKSHIDQIALAQAAHSAHVGGNEYGLWMNEHLCLAPEGAIEAEEIQDAYTFDMAQTGPMAPLSLPMLPVYLRAAFAAPAEQTPRLDPETSLIYGVRYKRLEKCKVVHSIRSQTVYVDQRGLELRARPLICFLHAPDAMTAWLEMYFEVGDPEWTGIGLTSLFELYSKAFYQWKEVTHVYSISSFIAGIRATFEGVEVVQVTKYHYVVQGLNMRTRPKNPRELITAKHKLGWQRAVEAGKVEDRPPMNEFQRKQRETYYIPPPHPWADAVSSPPNTESGTAGPSTPAKGKQWLPGMVVKSKGKKKAKGKNELQEAFEQATAGRAELEEMHVWPEELKTRMTERVAEMINAPPVPLKSILRSQTGQGSKFDDKVENVIGMNTKMLEELKSMLEEID